VQLRRRQPPELLVPFGFVPPGLIVVEQSPDKEGRNVLEVKVAANVLVRLYSASANVLYYFRTACSPTANKIIKMPTTKVNLRPPVSKRTPIEITVAPS
jgi:hypothetical protein